MPLIELETFIRAPRERVFDLARSIEAHQDSAAASGERAVAGVTCGLLEEGESVTWEATHFGVKQRLEVVMSKLDRPRHFKDVMVRGAFHEMIHDHHFEEHGDGTRMIDRFRFSAPLGFLGRLAERWFLTRYMRRFLEERNATLKHLAESGDWRRYLE